MEADRECVFQISSGLYQVRARHVEEFIWYNGDAITITHSRIIIIISVKHSWACEMLRKHANGSFCPVFGGSLLKVKSLVHRVAD